MWQEDNQFPSFVLEVTSKSPLSENQGIKRGLYAFWGVLEYFQYDPSADYLEPPLQGYRLADGNYLPLPAVPLPDGGLSLNSEILGLALHLEQGNLRFYNPQTGEKLLSHAEAEAARQTAEDRAERFASRLRELGIEPDEV